MKIRTPRTLTSWRVGRRLIVSLGATVVAACGFRQAEPGAPLKPPPSIAPFRADQCTAADSARLAHLPPLPPLERQDTLGTPVTAVADQPRPAYPSEVGLRGQNGEVELEFIVGIDGMVEPCSVRIVRATHVQYADAAIARVTHSRWNPARVDGQAVRRRVRQPYQWHHP